MVDAAGIMSFAAAKPDETAYPHINKSEFIDMNLANPTPMRCV
jgi:hypothetical protein